MFGIGGQPHEDEAGDKELIQAVRQRLLHEIKDRRHSDAQKMVNNIYGGHTLPPSSGGIGSHVEGEDPRDMSYFVDILRKNYDPGDKAKSVDPRTGEEMEVPLERGGWGKSVHRYTVPKKKVTE